MRRTNPSANAAVGASLFFVSFILIGTMIILNLFIGVIMTGMDEAQAEAERDAQDALGDEAPTLSDELDALQQQLAKVQSQIKHMQHLHPDE